MPSVASGSVAGVIASERAIVTSNTPVTLLVAVSVTWMVNRKLPAAVGVPLRMPVAGTSVRPPGSVPPATLHVYGGVPAVAWNIAV